MPEPLPEAIVTNLFSECAIYQLSYCFSPRQYGTPLSPPIVYFGQPFGRGPHLEWLRFHISHARSEEHTSELQSLMRISYAVFCLKKKKTTNKKKSQNLQHAIIPHINDIQYMILSAT